MPALGRPNQESEGVKLRPLSWHANRLPKCRGRAAWPEATHRTAIPIVEGIHPQRGARGRYWPEEDLTQWQEDAHQRSRHTALEVAPAQGFVACFHRLAPSRLHC